MTSSLVQTRADKLRAPMDEIAMYIDGAVDHYEREWIEKNMGKGQQFFLRRLLMMSAAPILKYLVQLTDTTCRVKSSRMEQRLNPRHILITGNMGYVGPAVVRGLRQSYPNTHLTGLDIGYFAHCLNDTRPLAETCLDQQWFRDLRDINAEFLHGVDAVANLAAISNDPMGATFETATNEVNFAAGMQLARLAKEKGVRSFAFASSCSVYGFAEGEARRETDTLNPLTAYARSKISTERALADIADDDFIVTCLRFPTACGMSQRLRLDLVLNDFVASAIATGKIDIMSDGTPWRPLIDTKDMARAFDWALQRDKACGGAFVSVNVGRNECNYEIKDLARAVAELIPGISVAINPDAAPDKRSYRVDFGLYAGLATGYLPSVTLGDSIRELANGLRAIGFVDRDFRESNYFRLNVLNDLKTAGVLDSDLRWVGMHGHGAKESRVS